MANWYAFNTSNRIFKRCIDNDTIKNSEYFSAEHWTVKEATDATEWSNVLLEKRIPILGSDMSTITYEDVVGDYVIYDAEDYQNQRDTLIHHINAFLLNANDINNLKSDWTSIRTAILNIDVSSETFPINKTLPEYLKSKSIAKYTYLLIP
jgi:hypothetical protein